LLFVAVLLLVMPRSSIAQSGFGPGERVLLDAHNAYPERGRYVDRIDRAVRTGMPVAIEQDLHWRRNVGSKRYQVVVAHDKEALGGAPTLESYFFKKLRPVMEKALTEQRREQWPLIVLNLDFKSNEPALLDAVFAILARHEAWLTTAPRTNTPDVQAPFSVGPLLVLTGSNAKQRVRFHDHVPVGQQLLAFGAVTPPEAPGDDDDEREANLARLSAEMLIPSRASNYARWVNFPWLVVEAGGPTKSGAWLPADSVRLQSIVHRAHAQSLWIRFYTLDGFLNGDGAGLTKSYNFGGDSDVQRRWRAAASAGVDFIATDHYERFRAALPLDR